uniref:Uncharacterized protein n=1 Tax=Caenorhabditis japonica TaxID=281687 RepID=A0A8R1ILU3_CAEJA
ESYFIRSSPHGLDGAQLIAVNQDGSLLYGLKVRIQISIVELPEQAPEVLTEATEKSICKYHVASGSHRTFHLDDDFDALQLTRILEFYVLADNLVVMLTYDAENYQFSQTVIHLESSKGWAQTIVTKRRTISRVSGPPIINLSFLDQGRVLICGARVTEDGKNERMTLSIAADPMRSFRREDDDLSPLVSLPELL